MKIAVVVRVYSTSGGGLERHAVAVVEGLIHRGHDVHLYAQRWDQPENPRLHYHRVPAVNKPSWLRALMFHWGVNRRVARTDYDIVLGLGLVVFSPQHIYGLDGGFMAEWLPVRYPFRAVRLVMLLLRPVLLVNWLLERRLMRGHVSWLVTYSSLNKAQASQWYDIPQDRISVIYNGYDPHRFKEPVDTANRRELRRRYGLQEDATVLLFVAQDFLRKGLDCLIRALPPVMRKNPRTWLVVVGKDKPARFQAIARREGIERRIIFAGSAEKIEEFYAMADALVFPTRFDPFPLVCLEAMACGLPVITTRVNGAADIIRDGKNGYVIGEPQDLEALTDRICRLLDPGHRLALGRAAAATARLYTWDRHLQEFDRLFQRIRDVESPAKTLRASLVRLDPDLLVNGEYRSLLERHGLGTFESLMGYEEGIVVKHQKGKRIFQLRLEWEGAPIVFYLKRHRLPLTAGQRLMHLFGRRVYTEGGKEWESILAFHDRQLPSATPVAMGERVLPGGIQESFVLTRGLEEYEPLESLAPKRFALPLSAERVKEKRTLIRAIAGLTAAMHWHGFYHRDFYSPHLMLRKDGPPLSPDLKLIDLQRVLAFPWLRRRWKVKDLASIHFSFQHLGLTRTDKMRFLKTYHPLAARDRSLVSAILRKTDRIARHDRHTAGPRGIAS
ncbi:MAG TPA: glycosyltransferase [Nitrospiria bacterium]|nr:glycosyltransferase [Nitrospiria bacterium]